jgi:hypothetical protein
MTVKNKKELADSISIPFPYFHKMYRLRRDQTTCLHVSFGPSLFEVCQ